MTRARSPIALCVTLVALLGGQLRGPAPARAQDPFPAKTVVGPDPNLAALGNVALSRDGTGGLIYLERVDGVDHVFVSRERSGMWEAPQQLDVGLAGGASQPVIAAADNGRLAAVFLSAGTLYASVTAPGAPRGGVPPVVAGRGMRAFGAPQVIAAEASEPTLGISHHGSAYTSFTVSQGGRSEILVARLDRLSRSFSLFAQPLNLDPGRDAGYDAATGSQIAVGTDGDALVAWGEAGSDGHSHVIARRVSDQGPSNAPQDLTLSSLAGVAGAGADSPSVAVQDVSDFAWVTFRQTFDDGGAQVSRTIARHELGSAFDPPTVPSQDVMTMGPTVIDPLTFPTADGADDAQVEMDGTGNGVASVQTTASHQVFADQLVNPNFGGAQRIDGAVNTLAPQPVTAIAGLDDLGAVAWRQSTGAGDPPSVHLRGYNGTGFEAEAVLSLPSWGAVDVDPAAQARNAPGGEGPLSAAADRYGDVFVAFLQGAPTATRLVVGGVFNAPNAFTLRLGSRHTTQRHPLISWRAASDGPSLVTYQVDVSGRPVGITHATSLRPRVALGFGRHNVTVLALNQFGQRTLSNTLALIIGARPRATRRTSPAHRARASWLEQANRLRIAARLSGRG